MLRVIQISTIVLSLFGGTVFAHAGSAKGKIELIRTHYPGNAAWTPPKFWFTLKGVKSSDAGGCREWDTGTVLFAGETSEMYSTVMANYLAKQEIAVAYDMTEQGEGEFCRAIHITMGNPPV